MRLRLRLNEHQLAVLDRAPASIDDLVAVAVAHDAGLPRAGRWSAVRPPARPPTPPSEDHRIDTIVDAGAGIALVLAPGDTLRIEQVVDGQCVDLNAFAMDASRRPFSAARTRMEHGLHPTTGAVLWSAPPEVPLLEIVADTAGGHDLGFPMCSEAEYERATGIAGHPSCFQIQLETQRQWGLTPHDPLNLWLPTDVSPDGRLLSWPAACRRGDHVELRAETDLLVVVNPCPDDLFGSSQYEPGPVRVMASSKAPPVIVRSARVAPPQELEVELPGELEPHLAEVRESGWLGLTDAAVARALLFRWWEAQSAGSTQMADHGQPTSQRSPTASD
jgi:uncharacterized protein YcgI (DUF1989 family)